MNPINYILNMQDNASAPIQMVAKSIGITNNQVQVLNNTFVHTGNIINQVAEKAHAKIGFLSSGFSKIKEKITDAFSIDSILEFGKKVLEARTTYEESRGIEGGLKDQFKDLNDNWEKFLISLGGSGILNSVLNILSQGLAILMAVLPKVIAIFKNLWSSIEPALKSIKDFINLAFSFLDVKVVMEGLAFAIAGVLLVVDWFSIGLQTLLDVLSPFATEVMVLAGAWLLWANATAIHTGIMAAFNAVMALSPITWIVIGVVALITVIGVLMSCTSGWGESWKHVVTGAKLLWEGFTELAKSKFNNLVDGFMINMDRLKIAWYKVKEALGLGDSSENKKMINQLNNDIVARTKAIAHSGDKSKKALAQAAKEFSQFEIKGDFSKLSKIKDSIMGATPEVIKPKIEKSEKPTNGKSDSIVSGGAKATNIMINIQKLQDDTKIYVDSSEKGISNLGEKVQEMLLRAVNSVNQMQTEG
ncbi:hypothetical protein GON26_20525 [Flavobacterium sp. GA093]|uniref:Phage tail tape measure protein n=1 Tax=Flavobacterium hydrocarbonoxydans TaxID=2683249 RepID=A0A6I4P0X6_9FLAO|nr:hypothetical protein [Flavobacterium hydrocarbonoxydans]MWB96754.1 hypothetical protein [Flavobacterium hydrocarbonoxydans]